MVMKGLEQKFRYILPLRVRKYSLNKNDRERLAKMYGIENITTEGLLKGSYVLLNLEKEKFPIPTRIREVYMEDLNDKERKKLKITIKRAYQTHYHRGSLEGPKVYIKKGNSKKNKKSKKKETFECPREMTKTVYTPQQLTQQTPEQFYKNLCRIISGEAFMTQNHQNN